VYGTIKGKGLSIDEDATIVATNDRANTTRFSTTKY